MANIIEKVNRKEVKVINLKEYEGLYVYDEDLDEYFLDIDIMKCHYQEADLTMPKYVYACEFHRFELDLDNILEGEAHDFDEDIIDRLNGLENLRNAIAEFNGNNYLQGSYYQNENVVINLL